MKKIILSFFLLGILNCNAPVENEYEFKYGIETNESIETNVTYLYKGEYVTEQIETIDANIESLGITQTYWESPVQIITDDLFYARIEIDYSNQAGWFYFIIDDEVYGYSYISNWADVTWIFAWYIDMNGDDTVEF